MIEMFSGIKISKKLVMRLLLFIALIGAAFIMDIYFDKHPVELKEIETGQGCNDNASYILYFYNPSASSAEKTSIQKFPSRILFEHLHNKPEKRYHQHHKLFEPGKEAKRIKHPADFNFCRLIFKKYSNDSSGDDPSLTS